MSSRKGAQKLSADFKQEDILQAVVVVDNFEQTFSPLTLTRPRALLPLVNTPLIEYTLECLCAGGVQQAIIYCCSHAEQASAMNYCVLWAGLFLEGVVRLIDF